MGVDVRLMSENQEIVRDLPDPAGGTFEVIEDVELLVRSRSSSRLLRYVDPWGDAVFNHLQMTDLLLDLDDLAAEPHLRSDRERRDLGRLRVMAERCRGGSHEYLWFLGD